MHLTPRNAEPKLQIMTNPFELVSDTHKATHARAHTHTFAWHASYNLYCNGDKRSAIRDAIIIFLTGACIRAIRFVCFAESKSGCGTGGYYTEVISANTVT